MHAPGLTMLGIALAAGCGLVGRAPADSASYFPMEADRVWEYRLHDRPRRSDWPVAVRSRGPRFVRALGRVATIFEEAYGDHVVPVAFYLAEGFLQTDIGIGYDGGRRMAVLPVGAQPMRLLPIPPSLGASWTYSEEIFGPAGDVPATFRIRWAGDVEAVEAVEVPAGTFRDCLRVVSVARHLLDESERSVEYRYVDWYAPDVGLVKSEFSAVGDAEVITRLELVRHYRDPDLSPADRWRDLRIARLGRLAR